MNTTWDAEKYGSDFSYVPEYGRELIGLIDAGKGASVLDLGCGNGTLTKELKDSGYNVQGIDQSDELLSVASEKCPGIRFHKGDASFFSLEEPVDVVFSNAVFHWIPKYKHPLLLACVYRALRDGGELVFEMGGAGNNARIHEALGKAFAAHGLPYMMPFYFPTAEEYTGMLERIGFTVKYAKLFERPTPLKGDDGMAEWIRMFVKDPFQAVSDESLKEQIIAEATDSLKDSLFRDGTWTADYVRLRMKAVK